MKRNYGRYRFFFAALLLFLTLFTPKAIRAYSEDDSRNVLILNSYHKGLSWTDQQTEGVSSILGKAGFDCNIFVEYMDWKNYPTEENLKQLYSSFKYKYSQRHIDVVVATDDAALAFALKNRADIFSDAPVVFSGVNTDGISELTRGYSRVTGITEIVDPENTVRAALKIYPGLKEIYVAFDNTESGLSTGAMTIDAIKRVDSKLKIRTLNDKSLQDILDEVAKAPDDSVVLITTYYNDAYGLMTGFEGFIREVSRHSRVPVFDIYDFGLNNGAIGGSMTCGRLQGENAGKIAVRILKGEDISRIPVETAKTTRYMFDYLQLERFGISRDRLPEGSEIINKPFSFFEAYKSLVVAAAIIFLLLVLFIVMLVCYLRKINRMKDELEKKNEEQGKLYTELEQSDNKLKQQFGELVRVQQSLTTSEKRYSLLFEKMLNGFFVFEPVVNSAGKLVDIRFVDINPGFEVQTRMKTDGMIGKTWTEVFGYPSQELGIYHSILHTGEVEQFETYYANGNVYYLVNAFKISDSHVGVVFDNITEYKQAIKEITILNEELEQRVAARTDELQSVVNELEAFTYTVSHDLKSPLRAVDGYSRIIMEDYGSKLNEDAAEMIRNIRNICRDMIEMINKLLQYSTTSKAPITKEQINIEEIFKSIFNELESANAGRNIRLTIETRLPMVNADRIMLRQVIYNILSNAVKFTKHRETAIIRVGCIITSIEYIFYVKDNGAGFDMSYSGKLFGIFQRLHTSDEFEGSGIGLVTVKKIIQKHGGKVWIEGKTGAGATVYFTLPIEW